METYTYNFTYKGHAVEYRIMAHNKHVANRISKQQEMAWRKAIEARMARKELASWS